MERVFMEYGSKAMLNWSCGLIEYLSNDNCANSKSSIEFVDELSFLMNEPHDYLKAEASFFILQLETGQYSALNLLSKIKGDWIRQENAIKNVVSIFRKIEKREYLGDLSLFNCFCDCDDAAKDCKIISSLASPYFCCMAATCAALGLKADVAIHSINAAGTNRKAKDSARMNLIQAIKGA